MKMGAWHKIERMISRVARFSSIQVVTDSVVNVQNN